MNIGYDPVMLDFVNIKGWLDEDTNYNFIIISNYAFNKNIGGVLLKSYFLNVNNNDLFHICQF